MLALLVILVTLFKVVAFTVRLAWRVAVLILKASLILVSVAWLIRKVL